MLATEKGDKKKLRKNLNVHRHFPRSRIKEQLEFNGCCQTLSYCTWDCHPFMHQFLLGLFLLNKLFINERETRIESKFSRCGIVQNH